MAGAAFAPTLVDLTVNPLIPPSDSRPGLVIRAHSPTQSAPLLAFQNSVGSDIGSIAGDGTPNFPGAGLVSLRIGAGSTADGIGGVTIGQASFNPVNNSVVIGYNSSLGSAAHQSILIGFNSSNTGTNSTVIGDGIAGQGSSAVAIGSQVTLNASGCVLIGAGTNSASQNGAICIGQGATANNPGQLIFASTTYGLSTCFFGPVQAASPTNFLIQPSGGLGTDIAGATFTIAAGRGTGAGVGGDIVFRTSLPGVSSTTLKLLSDVLRLSPTTQNALLTQTAAATKGFVVKGVASRTANLFQLQTSAGDSLGTVGGAVFDHFASVSTTHTDGTFDTLYSDTTSANTLAINGDKIVAEYVLTAVAHATATRQIKLSFAGVTIFDSTAQVYAATGTIRLRVTIIRFTSTKCRAIVEFTPRGSATIQGYAATTYTSDSTLTGLTLSGTNVLALTAAAAGTGAANGDIVAVLGTIACQPAA